MGQPTKGDLEAEVEELRTSLDQAHSILTRALGYDELYDDDSDAGEAGEAGEDEDE